MPPQMFNFTCQSLCPLLGQSHWDGSQLSGPGPEKEEKRQRSELESRVHRWPSA